ncbi:MAG: universal stress protein [SAR324 cluster bacterium]|nr:universal stress protein [SAR324 cluster bacterium]
MYQNIYVPVDNSPHSDAAARLALALARTAGAKIYGSHVYAAKLHDKRFRTMESGLPEQFQQEKELEKQRVIHDSLITKGLELITDSYLLVLAEACREAELEFKGISLEGANWKELVRDIDEHEYDLVVMGSNGMGRVADSLLGSVTERVARRIQTDLLIVKKTDDNKTESDKIVVCLDGSERSFGGLKAALELAEAFGKKVEAISAFDPYFHYGMFNSLNNVLSDKARKVFKFEEQEKLHEEIIDNGLAKIYQSHLDIAKRIADDAGIELNTKLLDGKAWKKMLAHVKKEPPWLLVLGRTGIHSDDEMDIGGNTENVLRLAPCNILMMETKYQPPVEYMAEETIGWTVEAQARMQNVPDMARGVAMKAIQQHAVAEGYTMITSEVVEKAIRALLPPQALSAMGIEFSERTEAKLEDHETFKLSFECPSCQYVHHLKRPEKCPVCNAEGQGFRIYDSSPVTASPEQQGITETTFDGRKLTWTPEAKMRLNHVPVGDVREQLRYKLEKRAYTRHQQVISEKMVSDVIEEDGISATSFDDTAVSGFEWTDEAVKRLARVPEGFMRKAAQTTIEEYASGEKINRIDLDVAEAGLGKAREKMQQSMQSGNNSVDAEPAKTIPEEKLKTVLEAGTYECLLCGYTHVREQNKSGTSVVSCEICHGSDFKKLSEEELKIVSATAFQKLKWNEVAQEKLQNVPAGYMRAMTKNRIEQWARKFNKTEITLEVVEAKYTSWGEGSQGLVSQLTWSDDAQTRIQRVPDFIRPMVKLEVERNARLQGQNFVDGGTLDQIMEKWGTANSSGTQQFHQRS